MLLILLQPLAHSTRDPRTFCHNLGSNVFSNVFPSVAPWYESTLITSGLPVTVGVGGRSSLTMFNANDCDLELELETDNHTTRVSRDEAATPEQRSDRLVLTQ